MQILVFLQLFFACKKYRICIKRLFLNYVITYNMQIITSLLAIKFGPNRQLELYCNGKNIFIFFYLDFHKSVLFCPVNAARNRNQIPYSDLCAVRFAIGTLKKWNVVTATITQREPQSFLHAFYFPARNNIGED
jgi:hypothetical protein